MERIKEIIFNRYSNFFPNNELDNDENFVNYGFDSYSLTELIVLLEEEFNVEIKDEFLLTENINTIEKLAKAVASSREQSVL